MPQSTSALRQLVFLKGTHLLKTKYILSPVYQEWIDTVPILSSFLATLELNTEKDNDEESKTPGVLKASSD